MKRNNIFSIEKIFDKFYNLLAKLEYQIIDFMSMVFMISIMSITNVYAEEHCTIVKPESITKSMTYSVDDAYEAYKMIENHFEWSNVSPQLVSLIFKVADSENFDRLLLTSIVFAESNFDQNCVSYAGAKGLIQLMPGTAKEMGLRVDGHVDERLNPEKNLKAGVQYIKKYKQVINDELGYCDMELALAGYNCGPYRVMKEGKIPNIKETEEYVKKIISTWKDLQDASVEMDM